MTNEEKYKTPEERDRAYGNFCDKHRDGCDECPVRNMLGIDECTFAWLALEAEEEKPLPCPFCKEATVIEEDNFDKTQKQVVCPLCGYRSARNIYLSVAVSDHNKFVLELKKGES